MTAPSGNGWSTPSMASSKPPTEIHCHLLPGVDDGARDLDDSIEMAAVAAEDGTRTVVVTPHVRSDFVTDVWLVREVFVELATAIEGAGSGVELRRGGELGHDLVGRLDQDELEAIAVGPPGRRWLLVESPFAGFDDEFEAATSELRDRGFGVVIAHPERASGVLERGWPRLTAELDKGSLLQINLWSLTGSHGAAAEQAAIALLRRGLVTVLASDAHPGWRRPTLTVGAAAAEAAGLDAPAARSLITDAPWALIHHGVHQPARSLARGVRSRTLPQ
jgi:protein-tyrosine phosphatase